MGRLSIKGKLQYMPGPWGISEPIKGAVVKIIDKDPGGSDDTILQRTTNSTGKFSGLSSDWKDKRIVRYWQPLPLPGRWQTKTVADPLDVMLLEIEVKHGNKQFKGPFIFTGNNNEVPVVLPWMPEDLNSQNQLPLLEAKE